MSSLCMYLIPQDYGLSTVILWIKQLIIIYNYGNTLKYVQLEYQLPYPNKLLTIIECKRKLFY